MLAQAKVQDSPGAIDRLVGVTRADMERVNALILSRVRSDVELVPKLANYLIQAGGKRLRPMLTIAAARLFGAEPGAEASFAAAIEFIHNATLLHDDVVDESDMRRGRPAARMVWGNQASVLVGDFLLGQSFLMLVETGRMDGIEIISRTATAIAEGEVLQLVKAKDLDTTEADYEAVITAKTAVLFEAATEVGALAGGADEAERAALKLYGRELGFAFQLVDDVLDYRGQAGELGKNTGDDLREGKMTLPVILALRAANPAERQIIAATLGDAGADEARLAGVVAIMERHGTLDHTLARAHEHAARARAALMVLPASELRELLGDVADASVARAS